MMVWGGLTISRPSGLGQLSSSFIWQSSTKLHLTADWDGEEEEEEEEVNKEEVKEDEEKNEEARSDTEDLWWVKHMIHKIDTVDRHWKIKLNYQQQQTKK